MCVCLMLRSCICASIFASYAVVVLIDEHKRKRKTKKNKKKTWKNETKQSKTCGKAK